MVEGLGIIVDRYPKGKPRKIENYTIEKIGYVPIFTNLMVFTTYLSDWFRMWVRDIIKLEIKEEEDNVL